ncbi:MAG: MOSC domain-containing protein [Acidobacteria bacterium]|nr:MOSC domain-containing protein [Acidobacteriota bacterium]
MGTPYIMSLQVGAVKDLETWTTGIYKTPVEGPVWLGTFNLAGDEQADLRVHGGRDKAVMVYPGAHYEKWNAEIGLGLGPGAVGENFTVAGLDEETVHLGDQYEIGEAKVEVSQPRQPCWKLAQKWNRPDLPKRVVQTGRTGWYFRVLQEGEVAAGDQLKLLHRDADAPSIAQMNRRMYRTLA